MRVQVLALRTAAVLLAICSTPAKERMHTLFPYHDRFLSVLTNNQPFLAASLAGTC